MALSFPKDGSIIIIDDLYSDAKPLIDILSNNGHPSIYFNGDIDFLPKNAQGGISLARVRVVFTDIQLKPALNAQQYGSLIIEHLNHLIPEDNGPYIIIVWTKKGDLYANTLQEMIEAPAFLKKPIAFIRLDKTDYFKTTTKEYIDFDNIDDELETRFAEDDRNFIINKLKELIPTEEEKICDKASLIRISNKIKRELKNYKAFGLLIKWEGLVTNAATNIISIITSIHDKNLLWDYNFRNIISRFAESQVGKNISDLNRKEFVVAALRTLNSAFIDLINSSIPRNIAISASDYEAYKNSGYAIQNAGIPYRISWKDFKHYHLYIGDTKKGKDNKNLKELEGIGTDAEKNIVKKMLKEYQEIPPNLNSKLNIDFLRPNKIQPGVVYEVRVPAAKKRKFLSETYFSSPQFMKRKKDRSYEVSNSKLNKIKFIELEVSPNCDYAQKKWLKNRVTSGILFPPDIFKLKNDDSFYNDIPEFVFNDTKYCLVLNFKLLKAIDLTEIENRSSKFLFRIKNEPMSDIITRMASHAMRIGLIEFK